MNVCGKHINGNETLPCGCQPGNFLCSEAVALWSNVRLLDGPGQSFEDYARARLAYSQHVWQDQSTDLERYR